MIIGIGTDIIEIDRVKKLLGKKCFFSRFFTEDERKYLINKKPESTAGYFCAKEATVKALGTGFSGFKWSDVEIIKINAVPGVILHGKALEIANEKGITHINLSISHCKTYAVATVIMD
jgi:holo-[acyl-carrier protein] synthase